MEGLSTFRIQMMDYMRQINNNAHDKGFWEEEFNSGEKIALVHSELSEALEGLRAGNPPDKDCPEFTNSEIEFADAVIRIMDYCYEVGFDLPGAIEAKHEFNTTRPYKHGKSF